MGRNDQLKTLSRRAYSGNGFLMVSKVLIKSLGLVEAAVLANYIDKDSYWAQKDEKYNDWFYLKNADQINALNLSENSIKLTKRKLMELNILASKMNGIPALEYFNIDYDQLNTLLENNLPGNEVLSRLGNEILSHLNINNKVKKLIKKDFPFIDMFPKEWQNNLTFQNTVEDFLQHRKEIHKRPTQLAMEKLAMKLKVHQMQTVIEAFNTSIESGWAGVFPEAIKNNNEEFKVSKYRPEFKYDGSIKYTLNPKNGEYYHANGNKYID